MEVLHEVLAALEDSFAVFGSDEEVAMTTHDCQDLAQCGCVLSR